MLPVVAVSSSIKLSSPVRIVATDHAGFLVYTRVPGVGVVVGHAEAQPKVCLEASVGRVHFDAGRLERVL